MLEKSRLKHHCLKHCILERRLEPSNSAEKTVIQISFDQVIILWWRKLNNVSLFLDSPKTILISQIMNFDFNFVITILSLMILMISDYFFQIVKKIVTKMLEAFVSSSQDLLE